MADTTNHPAAPARRYGRRYAATARLTLTDLATLIMADLIMIRVSDDPDEAVFPARISYAVQASPRHKVITVWVFGLTDAEIDNPCHRPADAPCTADFPEIIETVCDHYNWHSASGPDRRFTVSVILLAGWDQRKRANLAGTVTTDRLPARH